MSLWATVSTSFHQSKSYLLNPIANPPLHFLTWKNIALCSYDTSPFSVLFPHLKVNEHSVRKFNHKSKQFNIYI